MSVNQLSDTLEQLKNTQIQIVQSEKMSSLGQMVAGVAHEINNPVTFIHSNIIHVKEYTEGLLALLELYGQIYPEADPRIVGKQDEIDFEFTVEDLPKTLVSMQVGSRRIREIVLSLRNFSRIDEADLKPVDIHEGIENTLLILNHRLKPKSERAEIKIVREYGSIPAIECFAGLLNQVLMNVISNAIDAIEEEMKSGDYQGSAGRGGEARIVINTSVVSNSEGCDWLRLSVADNGPGIPPDVRERIFEPFFTTKAVGKGTGMGMSISYNIVTERHGGTIECATSREGGAEFIVHIPVCPAPSKASVA
ncbi:MAG: sensor histidine kinase [Geitlerinemataceae cyanobacterium]